MLLGMLRRQTGMSMTELMVGVGLLGGLSMVGMRLTQENAMNDTYVRFKAEVAKATAIIRTHLSDQNSCRTMLVGKERGFNHVNLTMTNRLGTATIVLLQENTVYDGFRIPPGGIRIEASTLETAASRVTDIVLTFEIRNKSMKDRKNGKMERIVKRIPVKTELMPDGFTIRSCGAVLADANLDAKKQLCDSLTAGAATWDGTDCRLNKISCPFGQVPFQLTSLGSMKCIPIDQKLNPSDLFEFSSDTCSAPGTTVRLTTGADGKIRAECL